MGTTHINVSFETETETISVSIDTCPIRDILKESSTLLVDKILALRKWLPHALPYKIRCVFELLGK